MTRSSSTRVLSLAAFVIVFALAFAPLSFAGEDPGPTQAAETVATAPVAPATPTTPSTTSSSSSSTSSSAKSTKDTVKAKGGVQTGLGGMAAGSGSSMLVVLALGGAGLVLLTGASGIAPLRRRSEG
jgi:hypothetical protein